MADDLEQDSWLLRFRWIMPLALLPLAILAALQADIGASGHLGRSLRDTWEVLCLAVAFAGLAIRVLTVGFGEDGPQRRLDDALSSTGMYSIVRYPLYLGTYVSLLGLSLLPGAIWFPLAVSAVFLLWYGRVVQQTELTSKLKHDGRRREAITPPLFLPNPLLWRQPSGRFSIHRALRREYNDFYFVVAGFVGLELACDLLGERLAFRQWQTEDLHWALLLAIGTLLYVALRPSGPRFPSTRAQDWRRSTSSGRRRAVSVSTAGSARWISWRT
jgi:protein-S-isoprenylcysteine O-methyltransferase Ste14